MKKQTGNWSKGKQGFQRVLGTGMSVPTVDKTSIMKNPNDDNYVQTNNISSAYSEYLDNLSKMKGQIVYVPTISYHENAKKVGWDRYHYLHKVKLGVLDDDAKFVFMNGQCHAFALAVQERTKWPIIVLVEKDPVSGGSVLHCMNEKSSGVWVDVRGGHDSTKVLEYWKGLVDGEVSFYQASKQNVLGLTETTGYAQAVGEDPNVCVGKLHEPHMGFASSVMINFLDEL